MSEMTWKQQVEQIEGHLETLFFEHPELFRPTEVIRQCSDPDCDHKDEEIDPDTYAVTGALMLVQQSSVVGGEITAVYCWPPKMGKVQKLGLMAMLESRMR